MTLIQRIVITLVVGVLLWLVNRYLPLDATISRIVNAVVVIALVVWWLLWVLAQVGINVGAM